MVFSSEKISSKTLPYLSPTLYDRLMQISSKLPEVGTTIFTVMSAMSQEYGAINLSQGFPNYEIDPALKDLVAKAVLDGHNQYAPLRGVPRLLASIANKISATHGWLPEPNQEICVSSGATEGLFSAIQALIFAGDEVILFEPAYDSYIPAIRLAGGIPIPIRLYKPSFTVDWDLVQEQVTPRTKMIIINSPHNPTGTIFSLDDMSRLEALAERHNLIVLSDEVYEHLIYDDAQHHSVLRFPGLRARSLATFSFGKTFHATGWRLGYIVGAKVLMDEFMKVHQFNTFCINTPLQQALAVYLEQSKHYLKVSSFFQTKRDLFHSLLAQSSFDSLPCRGSYFMLATYDRIRDVSDMAMSVWLTQSVGVAVIPISVFYSDGTDEKLIRFCFAKKDETLVAAADRLKSI